MNDLISRQDAIDAAIEAVDEWDRGYNLTRADMIADAINNNVPSAQPERKKGKWIERNPQNSDKCRLIECSECGDTYIVDFGIDYADWIEGRNFCRRCGADMRGEQDG